jgi:tricorn protease
VRLTYDAARSFVHGWTNDGKVIASTDKFSTLPNYQLYTIDPATRERVLAPLAQASDGCFETNASSTLYFTRLQFQGSFTKRYKGGTAQNLWRFKTGDAEATPLTPDFAGTSKRPLWWQGRVYFLTDRDGTMNIWSMQPDGKDLKQHTQFKGVDVQEMSLDSGRIAFRHAADIHIMDLAGGTERPIPITLDSDFDQTRERWVKKPMDYVTSAHLSADGDKVVLTARGRVFATPQKQGRLAAASHDEGVRYRSARFMPDGKSIVALSDKSGEVEVWQLPANGVGAPEQLTTMAMSCAGMHCPRRMASSSPATTRT